MHTSETLGDTGTGTGTDECACTGRVWGWQVLKGTLQWHLNNCQWKEPVAGAAEGRVTGRRRWDNCDRQTDRQTDPCRETQVSGTRGHGVASGVWSAKSPGAPRAWSGRSEPELRVQAGACGVAREPAPRARVPLGVGRRPARQRPERAASADASGPLRCQVRGLRPPRASRSLRAMERGQGDPRVALAQAPSPGGRRGRPCTKTAPRWVLAVGEDGEAGVQHTGTGAWRWPAPSRVQSPAPPMPPQ